MQREQVFVDCCFLISTPLHPSTHCKKMITNLKIYGRQYANLSSAAKMTITLCIAFRSLCNLSQNDEKNTEIFPVLLPMVVVHP